MVEMTCYVSPKVDLSVVQLPGVMHSTQLELWSLFIILVILPVKKFF
jgi:hypothetical protein